MNTALLEDPYLWKRWSEEICASVAHWKKVGRPIEVRWPALKAAAQRFWIEAGRQRSLQRRSRNLKASKRLAVLLQSMGEMPGNRNDIDWRGRRLWMEIAELKDELKKEEETRIQGMVARLRWQGLEEGERPTKFLSRLLRIRRVRQRWDGILGPQEELITDTDGILGTLRGHWSRLWSESDGGDDIQTIDRKLGDWIPRIVPEVASLTSQVREEEVRQVLQGVKNGTAPGEDGLPWDFWKKMVGLDGIVEEIMEMCDWVLDEGRWLENQDLGLVALLFKEKGERTNWKNWRPIMLLDMDRKLVTKILVARLQPIAQQVIGEDQRGFVGGRLIRDGTAWVHNLIEGARSAGVDGRMVFLDLEKAYDRVRQVWLQQVLRKLGMPEKFVLSVISLLQNSWAAIMMNGHRGVAFPLERGVPQGDPMSPLLYALALEPFLDRVR
jgi:hypothetical protein